MHVVRTAVWETTSKSDSVIVVIGAVDGYYPRLRVPVGDVIELTEEVTLDRPSDQQRRWVSKWEPVDSD